jgi:hypothetical protein
MDFPHFDMGVHAASNDFPNSRFSRTRSGSANGHSSMPSSRLFRVFTGNDTPSLERSASHLGMRKFPHGRTVIYC